MTKRQQAADAQAQLLQGNPELWKIAGDLFVKNLDWPGADELAKRLAKVVPPELKDDQDETPEMAQAKQMMQGMQQQMQEMDRVIQDMQRGFEAQKLEIDRDKVEVQAYDAQTKRMAAVSDAMTPEQVQDMIMGTLHGMLTSGDLVGDMPQREGMPVMDAPQQMPMGMPPQMQPGMPPQ
jgi:hypothetical protein